MKMLDILKAVKKELVELKYFKPTKTETKYFGMCSVASRLEDTSIIPYSSYEKFQEFYYERIPSNKNKFFDYKGNEVNSKYKFGWKPCDNEPRLKWLDRQINKLSK